MTVRRSVCFTAALSLAVVTFGCDDQPCDYSDMKCVDNVGYSCILDEDSGDRYWSETAHCNDEYPCVLMDESGFVGPLCAFKGIPFQRCTETPPNDRAGYCDGDTWIHCNRQYKIGEMKCRVCGGDEWGELRCKGAVGYECNDDEECAKGLKCLSYGIPGQEEKVCTLPCECQPSHRYNCPTCDAFDHLSVCNDFKVCR